MQAMMRDRAVVRCGAAATLVAALGVASITGLAAHAAARTTSQVAVSGALPGVLTSVAAASPVRRATHVRASVSVHNPVRGTKVTIRGEALRAPATGTRYVANPDARLKILFNPEGPAARRALSVKVHVRSDGTFTVRVAVKRTGTFRIEEPATSLYARALSRPLRVLAVER